MLIDRVKIYVKAGNGGNGAVSFRREKYVSHGGPDGGDGGHGANIVLQIEEGSNTLLYYKNHRKFVAPNGEDGSGAKFHGATAHDLILPVPPGTVVRDAQTLKVIKDMSNCEPFVLCKGGKGGFGNRHFATPTRQVPRFAKPGQKGQEREVILELKMLADVGFVGFPNVGKSTLLSRISDARPKIANYHFTTLSPNLGVVRLSENAGFVAADIPGLIEGASEGAGLGHAFLRHVDRCRLLLHVVDVSGYEGRDPVEDIRAINAELAQYSPELACRPQIIAANKKDLLDPDADLSAFESFVKEQGYDLYYICAASGQGVDHMIAKVYEKLQSLPPMTIYEAEEIEEDTWDPNDRTISISRQNDVFFVTGNWIERIMETIRFDDRESLMYFQKILKSNGVFDALIEKGIKDGDTVDLYGFEFDFVT